MKMAGAERERSFCENQLYLSLSSPTFRISITCDTEHWMGCVGVSSSLAEIKVFWKYSAYDSIKKTQIIPHRAIESFGWTFGAHMSEMSNLLWRNAGRKKKSLIQDLYWQVID